MSDPIIIPSEDDNIAIIVPSEETVLVTIDSPINPTISGEINISGVPSNLNSFATKDYVDQQIRDYDMFANYKTQDVDEVSNVTYVGKLTPGGKYLIERITDNSGDLVIQFANISNNPLQFTYSNAWGNRLTLTYNLISNLTGL